MAPTIAIEQLTLYDLEQQFDLQAVEDTQFFQEWQRNLLPADPSRTDSSGAGQSSLCQPGAEITAKKYR